MKSDSIPNEIKLSASKEDSKSHFEKYAILWSQIFQPKKLTQILEMIESGSPIEATDRAYLKRVRKSGSALRNAFLLFSQSHQPPKEFEKFVIVFGKLNDELSKFEGSSPSELAQRVLQMISSDGNMLSNVASLFRPSKREAFEEHFEDIAERARKLVHHRSLIEKKQHELRKIMREFMYYQLAIYDDHPTEQNRRVYQLLFEISETMGSARDNTLVNIPRPEDAEFEIDKNLRSRVQTYLDALQI